MFLPFLVCLYSSYTCIQQSFIRALELCINKDFDPALPGFCCAASGSASALSHPTAVLPKPPFHPGIALSHSCKASTTHSEMRQTPVHSLSHEALLSSPLSAICKQCTGDTGDTEEAPLRHPLSSNEQVSKALDSRNRGTKHL